MSWGPQLGRERALLIWRAQQGLCPICGQMLPDDYEPRDPVAGWSFEHVWPRARYRFRQIGNLLITHQACNNAKQDRDPTGCELIWLAAVNAQLGHQLEERLSTSWQDRPRGPTAMSLAFRRAMGCG